MSVGEISFGEMSVGEISVGEMSVGEMSVGEMSRIHPYGYALYIIFLYNIGHNHILYIVLSRWRMILK